MVKVDFVGFYCSSRRPTLDVDSVGLAADNLVLWDVDLVLWQGLDHDATTLEKCERGFFDKQIWVHAYDPSCLTVVAQVTFENAPIDF